MLHARTAIEYRAGAAAAIAPTIDGVDTFAEEFNERSRRLTAERALDEVLADSFPASDPPSWNTGIARPDPGGWEHHAEAGTSGTIDVSRPGGGGRTVLHRFVSLAGAAGATLLVPLAILLVGLPVVLAVRGLLEAIGWLLGVALQ